MDNLREIGKQSEGKVTTAWVSHVISNTLTTFSHMFLFSKHLWTRLAFKTFSSYFLVHYKDMRKITRGLFGTLSNIYDETFCENS